MKNGKKKNGKLTAKVNFKYFSFKFNTSYFSVITVILT